MKVILFDSEYRKNIQLDIIIIKIDRRVPEVLVLEFSIRSLAAIFQDGVPELLAPALKVILFDLESKKTYSEANYLSK